MSPKDFMSRKDFLLNHQKSWLEKQPNAQGLISMLENKCEGSMVVSPVYDSFCDKIMEKNENFDDWEVVSEMKPGESHKQMYSGIIWSINYDQQDIDKINVFLCKGYYLVKEPDKMMIWRSRTWLIDRENGLVIDPRSQKALSYVGYVMDVEECREYVRSCLRNMMDLGIFD